MEYKVKLEEFLKFGQPETPEILYKIIDFHLFPLNRVRMRLGIPVFIRSGYRSVAHELAQGRSGTSQHTFEGKGATDVALSASSTTRIKGELLYRLAQELVAEPFTRICFYPDEQFFHIDYKADKREFFINRSNGWESVTPGEFYKEIINNE